MSRMTLTALFWGKYFWALASAMSGLVVLVSSFADRRRSRRANIDKVGFMPWTAITVFAVLATVVTAALAIKGL